MANWSSITKVGGDSWNFIPGGTTPWREYLDGAIVKDTTAETSTIYEGTDSQEPPAVELLDSTDTATAQNLSYPPILQLQWRGSSAASGYVIQQYVNSAWSTYAIVTENGSGYYVQGTPAQADGTSVQWRVLVQDSSGAQGTAVETDITMVCNPGPPSISGSYSAGTGLLTISAR